MPAPEHRISLGFWMEPSSCPGYESSSIKAIFQMTLKLPSKCLLVDRFGKQQLSPYYTSSPGKAKRVRLERENRKLKVIFSAGSVGVAITCDSGP